MAFNITAVTSHQTWEACVWECVCAHIPIHVVVYTNEWWFLTWMTSKGSQGSSLGSIHWLVYLGGDWRSCDVGGGAVLCGRHAAVLLLLVLFLALHALVLCLPVWRAVGWRWEGRGRRWQIFQLVCCLLHLHHSVPQQIDCVGQCWQDELKALLDGQTKETQCLRQNMLASLDK